MTVSEVRVFSHIKREDGRVMAFCSVTLDNEFVITGVKCIEGEKGMFVSMPTRERKNGMYADVCHPINTRLRTHINDVVVAAVKDYLKHH